MLLQRFLKTPLYSRSETRQDPLLIFHEKENRVSKRNHELNDVSRRLQEILQVSRPRFTTERRVRFWFSKTNGYSKQMSIPIIGKPMSIMSMR